MSGEDASKPGKADPDFDPVLEEKNMTKEQHARAIRADRGGENPEQSLLDALEELGVTVTLEDATGGQVRPDNTAVASITVPPGPLRAGEPTEVLVQLRHLAVATGEAPQRERLGNLGAR